MNVLPSLLIGSFPELSWIRGTKKGNFLASPQLKNIGERVIDSGVKCLVIDLEECASMDSTFMGTLAGLAMKMKKQNDGRVDVMGLNERNARSLKELGLAGLLRIEPEDALWCGREEEFRSHLSPDETSNVASDKTRHVLEAHQTLIDADPENKEKFGTVLAVLEAEISSKTGPSL